MKVVRFRLGFSIESGLDLGQGSNDEGMHYFQPRSRPSVFIFIFLIFSAFSHEKTGTR